MDGVRDSSGQFIKGHASLLNKAARAKISQSLRGRVRSLAHRRNISVALTGKVQSESTRRKISASNVGREAWSKGMKVDRAIYPRMGHFSKHTEETKQKIRESKVGRVASKDTVEKMRVGTIRRYDRVGRKEYKRYVHVTDSKYVEWRSSVFTRDNWTCQMCRSSGCYLEAHHIKSWAEYPALRYELTNGMALCKECHALTDNYKNKKPICTH